MGNLFVDLAAAVVDLDLARPGPARDRTARRRYADLPRRLPVGQVMHYRADICRQHAGETFARVDDLHGGGLDASCQWLRDRPAHRQALPSMSGSTGSSPINPQTFLPACCARTSTAPSRPCAGFESTKPRRRTPPGTPPTTGVAASSSSTWPSVPRQPTTQRPGGSPCTRTSRSRCAGPPRPAPPDN
ncbi:hypothetical protein [Micromonospora sp. NPDC050276]|uniref:hypothetical protein n=1 Tax=Micromonospora sp. NPDC050276 TaxID=3364278 RepID=UPI00379C2E3C